MNCYTAKALLFCHRYTDDFSSFFLFQSSTDWGDKCPLKVGTRLFCPLTSNVSGWVEHMFILHIMHLAANNWAALMDMLKNSKCCIYLIILLFTVVLLSFTAGPPSCSVCGLALPPTLDPLVPFKTCSASKCCITTRKKKILSTKYLPFSSRLEQRKNKHTSSLLTVDVTLRTQFYKNQIEQQPIIYWHSLNYVYNSIIKCFTCF